MSENDDIDVEYVEPDLVEEGEVESSNASGIGWVTVIGASAIAAIIGALGGAFGAQFLMPKPDLTPVKAQIERAVADVQDENRKEIGALKATVQTLRQQINQNTDSVDFTMDINDLGTRLSDLENRPVPELPEITSETLDALQAAQADGFTWPDNADLNLEMTDLKAELALLKSDIEALKLQPFAVTQGDLSDVSDSGVLTESTPIFPLEALINAAKADEQKEGFLARTFSRHVKVNKSDDPVVLIEDIAGSIEAGDMRAALLTYDKLPEDLQQIGADWRASVEAAN